MSGLQLQLTYTSIIQCHRPLVLASCTCPFRPYVTANFSSIKQAALLFTIICFTIIKRDRWTEKVIYVYKLYTLELHLYVLIATACHPDMRKIRITGFFFENRLHWQFDVEKSLQTTILGYVFIYVQIIH